MFFKIQPQLPKPPGASICIYMVNGATLATLKLVLCMWFSEGPTDIEEEQEES